MARRIWSLPWKDTRPCGQSTVALKNGGSLVYYNTVWQPLPVRLNQEKEISTETISDLCNQRRIKAYPVTRPDLDDPRMQNIAVLAIIDQKFLIPDINTRHYQAAMEDLMTGDMLAKNMRLFEQST